MIPSWVIVVDRLTIPIILEPWTSNFREYGTCLEQTTE